MLESLDVHHCERLDGWSYEWVVATARYTVDPEHPANSRIVDLGRAPRHADGLVRFDGDVRLLRPIDPARGNGRTLVVIPNRGMTHGVPFSAGAPLTADVEAHDPGDGFLLDRGWTIAWCGWQWDVVHGLGLRAPVADVEPGWMRIEFRAEAEESSRPLSDSSFMFTFRTNPPADPHDPQATLTVRTAPLGERRMIPRDRWRFVDGDRFELDGRFQPFHWYELVYRCAAAPVAGCGLLAARDLGARLRSTADHVFAYGVSQSGRFLRQLLHDGLNVDEGGTQVFDGVFAHIASARRGEFNMRYAQPGLTHPLTPGYGPPHDTASLLARQRALGGVPKLVLTNSSTEYWRGDGALVHQRPLTGDDLPDDADARAYLIAGTDHLGAAPIKDMLPVANPTHTLDASPVLRALFVALERWVIDGVEPPASRVPRWADGTIVERDAILDRFGAAGAAVPDPTTLMRTPRLDPESTSWPLELGEPAAVALVSAIDDTGNEVAGIRLPAVAVPTAAFTAWNPRRHVDGLPDVAYEFTGSLLPRLDGAAPPPRAEYEAAVHAAARKLVDDRLLLEGDLERTVTEALVIHDQLAAAGAEVAVP